MHNTSSKTKKLTALLLASAVTLAACGGSDDDEATDDGFFTSEEATDAEGEFAPAPQRSSDETEAIEGDAMEDEAMEEEASAVSSDDASERGGFFGDDQDAEAERTEDNTFEDYGVRPFVDTARDPFSTFALDVDTASFSIAQQWLGAGQRPPI